MTTQQSQPKRGIVKQVVSGDSVILRGASNPALEKQINFSGIQAPKLARRIGTATADQSESKDEPWAWEAREFLRKKLIGEEVYFISQIPPNSTREYGVIYFGKDFNTAENITNSLISEGLVTVKKEGVKQTEELQRLIELENVAKQAGKGKWGKDNPSEHVRDIKWSIENEQMSSFVKKHNYKPIKAIIEHIRDGSTVRAFLLPEFYHVTVMITGIRCPGFKLDSTGKPDPTVKVPFAEEARSYVEFRLLQKDVEIILESVNNNNFIGTVIHPKGNIAEFLLREGLAHCENRLRIWKDWQAHQPKVTGKERDYNAVVTEVVNGDAIMVKLPNGDHKKVFLSSIRAPKEGSNRTEEDKNVAKTKVFRPLYDIPYMFEAREYLRRELIGKKVHVLVDYIQEARESYPEKICATVTVGGKNVAEGLVAKGLASVVKYRADDDQRSSRHHDLLEAETKAIKSQVGIHSKKKAAPLRVTEIDATRAKQDFSLQRAHHIDAIVEFVTSGSRLRLYIPKQNTLCTFLLGGINCPRAARPAIGTQPATEAEPFGEEAYKFTKERCLQREVTIQVTNCSTTGKTASLIGWLWSENVNLSVALVKLGYATVHRTGEKSQFAMQLKEAEDFAKTQKLGVWKNYVEEKEEVKIEDEKVTDELNDTYEEVIVTEITPEGNFFVQRIAEGPKAEALNAKFRQEFQANPPLPGSFTPKRGEICAAKFSMDDEWYRVKVEKIQEGKAQVHYIDYGNRENLALTRLASLPSSYAMEKPFATEYCLPFVTLPKDEEFASAALKYFKEDAAASKLFMNIVYRNQGSPPAASLHFEKNPQTDIIKNLIAEGVLLVENTKSRRNNKVLAAYKEAQEAAKKKHLNIWEYGDITEDDAKEFGLGN
ncbi:hypothetical protein WA026_023871 [Henosepilachna vigintioctopunctata]|uniref:Staphylococcal nuclease domain-containing protein 1 n=1 Tax=Henosepilachna vigintioctopunctata TaxID=420089 RepID=A0AAW1UP43_9CUCU